MHAISRIAVQFRNLVTDTAGVIIMPVIIAFVAAGCYHPNKGLEGASTGVLGTMESEGSQEAVNPSMLSEIVRDSGSTIQAGDEISINVLQDEKLNGTYRIDNDGGFQWHYVGRVKTDSLTTSDLRRKLTDVVAEYINQPSVIVNYTSQQPRMVRVLGEVRQQGHFPLKQGMRIVDAIASASGVTDDANRQEIVLVRSVSPTEIRAGLFNYREAMLNPIKSGAWKDNIELAPGDTIFVARNDRAQWMRAIEFINQLADAAVGMERTIILYPDVESVISTGDTAGRNTIVVR